MEKVAINKFDVKKWYVANFELFENSLNGSRKIPFHEIRKEAISKFSDMGFPTSRNEDWKYTNIAPILAHKFKLETEPIKLAKNVVNDFIFEGLEETLLVFVNGQFSKELSRFNSKSKGLMVDSLRNMLQYRPEIVNKYLGRYAAFENESFTALNTAFTYHGTFIYVPERMIVEEPIHIINLSDSSESAFVSHPRNLCVVGKGSQINIIESYHHFSNNTYFNNVVTEVVIGENAIVNYIKIQEEGEQAYHIANTQVHQENDSVYSSVNIDLGGTLVRNNLNVLLNGQNCETNLYGFYIGGETQHIDNHTFIDHAKPHCHSNELYKGILDGKARGVFNG
ncbi:MAG: SufD family Fe-S cluster assembly protein, partial [bacterium]